MESAIKETHQCEDILRAAQKGHLKCIEAALKKGADVNCTRLLSKEEINEKIQLEDIIQSRNGGYCRTPLMLAAENGHVQCVGLLLKSGADVNQSSKMEVSFSIVRITALMFAVREGHNLCVQMLLQAGADVNVNAQADVTVHTWFYREIYAMYTPLLFAIKEAHLDCLQTLIQAGAHVNYDESGRYQLKPELLHTAITLGAYGGTTDRAKTLGFVALLLDVGAKVKPRNIKTAVEAEWTECLELLVKSGADVNKNDEFGGNLLNMAVIRENIECIDILLKAGANVNAQNFDHETALTRAIFTKCDESFRHLIASGADVNQVGRDDVGCFTPLICAARHDNLNATRALLKAGAKVNMPEDISNADEPALVDGGSKTREMILTLLFAAGETIDKITIQIPEYLKPSEEINLMNISREAIRKCLLRLSDVNLFVRVPKLPLPPLMMSYLIYDVTLDDETSTADE